jgi:copper transport outer membrane protein MctB
MISLRQHVTSLVAVFLALAVGIALGGGLLADDEDQAGDQPGSPAASTPTSQAPAGDVASYADAFATAGAARLYANGLDGHAAVILGMPGADPAQIKTLTGQIIAAGGAITGTFTAGEALVDPEQRTMIDTLGTQLTTQLADPRIDPAATTYDRMGELIALAMSTDQVSSVRADPAAVAIRQALADASLLTSPTDVRNAPLLLVVLPPGEEGASDSLATKTILAGLVNGLGSNAAGVVVTGDTDSAEGGELAALRGSELVGPVSTVDGVETPIGQVTTVLAMMNVLLGTGGAYGASGPDGAVPLG